MSSGDSMVDGYPVRKTDDDFAIHREINELLLEFKVWQPVEPLPDIWLTPALERLVWNLREDMEGPCYRSAFQAIIRAVIKPMQSVSDRQFFVLCERVEHLRGPDGEFIVPKICLFGLHLHETQMLSPASVDQFWKLLRSFHGVGLVLAPLQPLALKLFRDRYKDPGGSGCGWASGIQRDILGMPKQRQTLWRKLLDANDFQLVGSGALPKPATQLMDQIDPADFVETVARWTQALTDAGPVHLRDTSSMQLNWLLRICDTKPDLNLDESLYRIASAKWMPAHFYWLSTFLKVLLGRPPAKSFACVEALAMNPATGGIQPVIHTYEMLLRNSTDIEPVSGVGQGVDGFVLDASHEYAPEQRLVDQLLGSTAPSARQTMILIIRQASMNSPTGINRLVLALSKRVRWFTLSSPAGPELRREWRGKSAIFIEALLGALSDPPLEVTLAVLDTICTGELSSVPQAPVFELCRNHVEKHSWHLQLVAAMQRWAKSMHGGFRDMAMRRKVAWFLLSEDVSPLKVSDCWGNIIRFALRKMPLAERLLWIEIVGNGSTFVGPKPPAKWLTPAKEAYAKVTRENFRSQFRAWFEPFRAAEPLKLTAPGADLLRILIWYALVAEDPDVDEAVTWLAQVKWKNKASAGKTFKSMSAFSYVLSKRNPATAHTVFEEMLKSGAATMNSRVEAAYRELCQEFAKQPVVPIDPGPKLVSREEELEKTKQRLIAMVKPGILQMVTSDTTGIFYGNFQLDEIDKSDASGYWDGDILVLTTRGETYRLDDFGNRITRDSDGATIRVDAPWDEPQYKWLRPMLESPREMPGDYNKWTRMGVIARIIVDDPSAVRAVLRPS